MKRISRIIKVPFKFIGSPIKFIYNKRKKLVKLISPSNVKIISVKILTMGKRTIMTAVFIVTIITSSGMETQKTTKKSYTFSQNSQIERIVEVSLRGGAINNLWSPRARAKYESTKAARAAKANKLSSTKRPNLRRRLLSIPGSDSHSRQQIPNSGYKKSAPSMNDNIPKSGKGLRVRSIAKTDENGEMETIYYNKDEQIIDGPAESKFLDDEDLASDVSQNPTDPHIQSETKIQTETVHNQNSGLTKARNNLTPVQDDKLTAEGDFVNPSQLTSKGRSIINKTKDRRAALLLQSRYEDKDKEFLPAYGIQQVVNKDKHTLEALEKLGKNITKYIELPEDKQLQIDLTIVEGLLAHTDTELYMNVMGQGREPIAIVLNRGLGDYPLTNHIGTFERRPEICKYNPYISNYLAKPRQIENFDASNSSSITYQDLVGNLHTNIGPVFGKTASPTSAPTVNDVDSEL